MMYIYTYLSKWPHNSRASPDYIEINIYIIYEEMASPLARFACQKAYIYIYIFSKVGALNIMKHYI